MRIQATIPILSFFGALTAACGGGGGGPTTAPPPPPPPAPLSTGPDTCVGGFAGDFACVGIDLERRLPLTTFGGSAGNDTWAWVDPDTGREYALMGMSSGTAFIDVSMPQLAINLGLLRTQTAITPWRDIKVHSNHAYIVADNAGQHGMQIFDLTRLRGVMAPREYQPDAVYSDFGSAHNIAINEETAFAYVVGSDTCAGGLHIIDLTTPINPTFSGCHASADTHDTQCVVYAGPDPDHAGREICFSSNEDHIEIADVTDKSSPFTVAAFSYPDLGFVHQGWLTEDQAYFLVGDELDEADFGEATRTHIFDVGDLDNPGYVGAHEGTTTSTDHNLYVRGNLAFEANYSSGLRVLELTNLATAELTEIAFFDTVPANDGLDFVGAWSVYPYLPSGTIIVSDTVSGLFILSMPP